MFHEDLKKIVEVELLNHIDLNKKKILSMWDIIHNWIKYYSDPKLKRILRINEIKYLLREFVKNQLDDTESLSDINIKTGGSNHNNLNRFHYQMLNDFIELE